MTLTDLVRSWLKETYGEELWIQEASLWNGSHIKNWNQVTIAIILNDVPSVETFRTVRSKDRQLTGNGTYMFNYNKVNKDLRPSNPDFLKMLKHELDLIKAANT